MMWISIALVLGQFFLLYIQLQRIQRLAYMIKSREYALDKLRLVVEKAMKDNKA